MRTFLVTWNLNKESPARYAVARSKVLKQIGCFEYAYDGSDLDSVALIHTADNIDADFLLSHIQEVTDFNDVILVVELQGTVSLSGGYILHAALQKWSPF